MDKRELETKLKAFEAEAKRRSLPISKYYVTKAFAGDPEPLYILRVGLNWFQESKYYSSLKSLVDVLWDTTDEDIRRHIFAMSLEEYHPEQDELAA